MSNPFAPYELSPFEDARDRAGEIDLLTRCYAEYGQVIELDTLDEDLFEIERRYCPPASAFWVLRDGPRLVGSVAVKGIDGSTAELKRVFLDAALRGRGLGKALSRWAIDWARDAGYTRLDIWSDVLYETAHRLYLGLGAHDTGETRELGGRNHVFERGFVLDLGGPPPPGRQLPEGTP
ncbi:MAG: GNAT family N-acetyltransferase [Planctomycetota bacterium]